MINSITLSAADSPPLRRLCAAKYRRDLHGLAPIAGAPSAPGVLLLGKASTSAPFHIFGELSHRRFCDYDALPARETCFGLIHGGAFGSTGQRCTATSRVIANPTVKDALVERLVAAAKKIKIGPGLDETVDMEIKGIYTNTRKVVAKNIDKAYNQ